MRIARLIWAVVLVALTASGAEAQERRSALGSDLSDYGGFVGLDTRFGDMMGQHAAFAGGQLAVLAKHRVYLGVRGAGLVSDVERIAEAAGAPDGDVEMGYGGFLIGYIVPLPAVVQLAADATIGGGGIKVEEAEGAEEEDWDALFVFEPSLGAEIRLARFATIGMGVGYRYIGGVDSPGLRDSDLRGVIGTASLRLGWF